MSNLCRFLIVILLIVSVTFIQSAQAEPKASGGGVIPKWMLPLLPHPIYPYDDEPYDIPMTDGAICYDRTFGSNRFITMGELRRLCELHCFPEEKCAFIGRSLRPDSYGYCIGLCEHEVIVSD